MVLAVHDGAPKMLNGKPERNLGSSHATLEVTYGQGARTANKTKKSVKQKNLSALLVDKDLSEEL